VLRHCGTVLPGTSPGAGRYRYPDGGEALDGLPTPYPFTGLRREKGT